MVSRKKGASRGTNIWSEDESESEEERKEEKQEAPAASEATGKSATNSPGFHEERSSESDSEESQSQGTSDFDITKPPNENTLRILVATDNHLGYLENGRSNGCPRVVAKEDMVWCRCGPWQ